MLCNKVSFLELLDCFGNDLENNFENNAWKLGHNSINAEELQEILNRMMQVIVSVITSVLHYILS